MTTQTMDLYADAILEHYRHPHKKEVLAHPSVEHREENVSCGDVLAVQLHIDNDHITNVGWEGTGCAISQAAMSMLSDELIDMTIDAVLALEPKNITSMLGVPIGPRRTKCALLCLHTLKNAIRKAKGEDVQGWMETIGEGK